MRVRRFQPGDVEPIARLNERLRAGNATDVVYPEGREQEPKGSIRERLFVAEDDGEIRGGVWLKEQTFRVRGEDLVCGWLKYPVAESLVDSRFNSVPGSLLVQCLREQPRLLALGLGGHETPLARMLKALKWTGATVPMLVRVVRAGTSLRQLAPMRRSGGRRASAEVLAVTGIGQLGLSAFNVVNRIRTGGAPRGYLGEPVARLESWADDVWTRECDRYPFLAKRDAANVEAMLPASTDIQRLRVRRDGADIGWVAVLRHDFSVGTPDPNFGTLTVGMIADAMAAPEHAAGVVSVAFDFLESSGADVVISNQLHSDWLAALRRLGFIDAPSNFAFYAAPKAAALAGDFASCHVNRGDCDGPMWYAGR